MTDYNKYFHLDVGEAITENEFQVLMSSGKFWTTRTRMDRGQAHAAMGGDIMRFEDDERTYGGLIYADNLEQAERIAKKRGWGEEVQGCLCGVIPNDHEIINPLDIKNLN